MTINEINERIEAIKEDMFLDMDEFGAGEVSAISHNCYATVYVDPEETYIAVVGSENERTMNYYAGFEYIDEEYITRISDVVIYDAEAERVMDFIDSLKRNRD